MGTSWNPAVEVKHICHRQMEDKERRQKHERSQSMMDKRRETKDQVEISLRVGGEDHADLKNPVSHEECQRL